MDESELTTCRSNVSPKLEYYFEMARAFATLSYQGVYILDLKADRFVFTSDHSLLRCGFSEKEMLNNGFKWYASMIPDKEQVVLSDIKTLIVSHLEKMSLEYRRQVFFSMNFHINLDNHPVMVCHKLYFLDFDDNGFPQYQLGLVSHSVHRSEPVFLAAVADTDYAFIYSIENRLWEPLQLVHLSNAEKTMLRLSAQGYSLEDISILMFKSIESIKYYRRCIFSKLGVNNISEAIAHASHYCMI